MIVGFAVLYVLWAYPWRVPPLTLYSQLLRYLAPAVSMFLLALVLSRELPLRDSAVAGVVGAAFASLVWLGGFVLLSLAAGAGLNPYTPTWLSSAANLVLIAPIAAGRGLLARGFWLSPRLPLRVVMLAVLVYSVSGNALVSFVGSLASLQAPSLLQVLRIVEGVVVASVAVAIAEHGVLAPALLLFGLWAPKGLIAWAPAVPREVYIVVMLFSAFAALLPASSQLRFPLRLRARVERANPAPLILPLLAALGVVVAAWKGYMLLVVLTGSMTPSINPGDVVLVGPPPRQIGEGTIVAYSLEGHIVLHRVVQVYGNGTLVTKGDANTAPDKPIDARRVLGVYKLKMPYLGKPVLALASATGNMLAAQMLLTLVILAPLTLPQLLRRKLRG